MSYVDEMSLQFGPDDDEPVPDQEAVIEAFLEETGRVAVDAAAGTGKTTTMLTTVAETVVRESNGGSNPFRELLLTTFTTDAANELKTRLKATLRSHLDAGGELHHDVFRRIETESQIRTIDSLFHELLTEVGMEAGLPTEFELEDGEQLQSVRDDAFAVARTENRAAIERLEAAYPDESWRAYSPSTVREMIESAQQKCREFCVTPSDAHDSLRENLDAGHGGQTPPTSFAEIQELLETVVFDGAALTVNADSPEARGAIKRQFTDHVRSTYERSRQLVDDFAAVLDTYDRRYDELSRERGAITHMDATHLLRVFVESNPGHPFVESLQSRFEYVFVDEFQDTSIAQARVLKELVSGDETHLLVIGDVKQSIYQWRSADPSLFGDIISTVADAGDDGARIPYFDVDDVVYRPLVSNFRSHPDLVSAANHVFDSVFDDPGRGAIGDVDVSYVDVDARSGRRSWDDDSAHFHVLDLDFDFDANGYPSRDETWTPTEAERVAATIDHLVDGDEDSDVAVFEDADEQTGRVQTRQADPGDVTLLFRTTTYMHRYAEALRDRGIDAAPRVTGDLFEQPEISVLVDTLYWFSNPHEEGALLRILRSPLVACSDATLRYVASGDYYLASLLEDGEWPAELPDDDRERIASLVDLRDDLRWDREGSKTDLINRILRHSAFDAVVLADEDGIRRYGNLWLLTDVVDSWEEEELLSYREFVDRLVGFRERATDVDGEPEYEVADISDPDDEETVTLTTIHAAKGREFPIVFLCDLFKQSTFPRTQHERFVTDRQHGFALRPKPGEASFPDGVEFDTPDDEGDGDDAWLHDDRDDGDYPDLTGPIWISDERNDDGRFKYRSPLNEFVRPDASEFWRMFYVAFTRAADHLFVGLSSCPDWATDLTRWTTWMTTLNEHLEPDEGWSTFSGTTLDVSVSDDALSVGVDDVPTAEPTQQPTIDIPDFEQFLRQDPMNVPETVPFRPLQISPSRIHDLLECPRRYQYQHVQQIEPYSDAMNEFDQDGVRTSSLSSPGSAPASEWGTIVHEALETQLEGSEPLARYLNRLDDPLREHVQWITESFRRDVDSYRTALDEGGDAHAEFPVATVLDVGSGDVHVTGEIDLLYESDDGYHLVDYKTTAVPDDGTYKAEKYSRQLRTYAWALEREHAVEITDATLLYVDVDVETETVSITPVDVSIPEDKAAYADELRTALRAIDVASPTGLTARPSDRRCGGCPYAASQGGPCEHE